jgi:hypothetical protein
MSGSDVRRGLLFMLVFALLPVHAVAQDTFEKLAGTIREGQKVVVRDATGVEFHGTVQSVTASSLVARVRFDDPANPARTMSETRTFSPAEVKEVLRPGPIWDGAIKGALVGLIPVVAVAARGCYGCGRAELNVVAVSALIGLGVDAAWGPKTVYRNAGASSRSVTFVPVLGTGRRGLAASIRF